MFETASNRISFQGSKLQRGKEGMHVFVSLSVLKSRDCGETDPFPRLKMRSSIRGDIEGDVDESIVRLMILPSLYG